MPIIEHHDVGVDADDYRVFVDVTDPQRRAELLQALNRALNCWERAPTWLIALFYELQLEKTHDQVAGNQRPEVVPEQG